LKYYNANDILLSITEFRDNNMKTLPIKSNKINLPSDVVRKLGGNEVEILETKEGILLRPVGSAIKRARGFLKGKASFSSNQYMANKQGEKELE